MPPNDPRFLALTDEDILTELVAWGTANRPGGAHAIEDEDEDFDLEDELARIEQEAEAEEQAAAEEVAAAEENPEAWEDVAP